MRKPRIPPMLADLVQTALTACDGTYFDSRDACPSCGGNLSGYDKKEKQFAVLVERGGRRPVHVIVKRFSCRVCKKVCFADEPFYPGTRTGSPVVDLCLTLSATMPFTRTAAYLEEMGIVVDRMTVRNFSHLAVPDLLTADVFGIHLPMSIISLSTLAAGLREGCCIEGAEALAACGFPSAHRAALHGPIPEEEGDQRDEEDNEEERQVQEPHHGGERE
jgi:hypothetical protein